MRVIVKIGSSSLTKSTGAINHQAIEKLCDEVAELHRLGHSPIIVTSGGIAAGLDPLGFDPATRPRQQDVLRAASAVGQISLMASYNQLLRKSGLVAAQVLLVPTDMWQRQRYVNSRGTLEVLLAQGVVPVVNENDAVADDEIRFGDNDRLAALVAHLVDADRLVLLTDTPGLFTADPRVDANASLIEEIVEFDHQLESMASGPRSSVGSGGMASKLAAAKMATWSGVETIIAQSDRENVVVEAVAGVPSVGTVFRARNQRLSARKLWIAFASPSAGVVTVDAGARAALESKPCSLLPAGVVSCDGSFGPDQAVEVKDETGEVFAKGLSRWSSENLNSFAGRQTADLPETLVDEVIHRDDLVSIPAP